MEKDDDSDMAGVKLTLNRTPRLEAKVSDNLPPAKYGSFLDYPFEIRAMVYEGFFATEFCESDDAKEDLGQSLSNEIGSMLLMDSDEKADGCEDAWEEAPEGEKIQTDRRMTAYDKVSLLLANKAVLEEASPFFYRLHEFQLIRLEQGPYLFPPSVYLPRQIKQVLGLITKVRIVNQNAEDREQTILFRYNVCHYIPFLRSMFTSLRSLTIDIGLTEFDSLSYIVDELQQLWPRLDYLQLIIEYMYWGDVENALRSIAAGLNWSYCPGDRDKDLDSDNQRFPKGIVCSLERNCLEKDITKIRMKAL